MDAETIFKLLKPQLKTMDEKEKKSLSNLIVGKMGKNESRRSVMTVKEAKEKLELYRSVEIQRERQGE